MAVKSSSRGGIPITLVAIHTNEGDNPADVYPDRTAENLARYLGGVNASYHAIVDDDSVVPYVPDQRYAWALRRGNPRSLNLCFTGWASWSRGEWLRHDRMLRLGADRVRAWCDLYDIPIRKLTPAEVGRDLSGIIGHHDWTVGKNDGSHWDPGPGFPWDVFLGYVREQEPAVKRKRENVIENIPFSGTGTFGFILPVGKASGITARAWLSAASQSGNGTIKVFAQGDKSGIADWTWSLAVKNGLSNRPYKELPDGTTQVIVQHNLPGSGVICYETLAK